MADYALPKEILGVDIKYMILIAKVNPKVSYVWQSVIKARDALLDGFSLPLDDS